MNDIIATIKLALGEVGFYDPLSGIHLSIGNPVAYVRAGVNTSQLQSSVRSGRLILVEGSLGNPPPEPISFAPRIAAEPREIPGEEKVAPVEETRPVPEVTETEKEAIRAAMEETTTEESVEEEITEEETVEESSNEPETEKKSKKKKKK
nr:MAG TPA: hypothetical protein [Caudoviricetes sp.]